MLFKIPQIALPFLWLGFVCAISFMEAPLKFTAPNITLPLGLGIGYIVFHTLNKIEIIFCLLLTVSFFGSRTKSKLPVIVFGIVAAILILQTFWLFPLLDERTMKVIGGNAEPNSYWHVIYIILDSAKVLLLLGLGVGITRSNLIYERH
jgi:hypothetical protein